MRNFSKRTISVLTALCLLMSFFVPATVSAEDGGIEPTPYGEMVYEPENTDVQSEAPEETENTIPTLATSQSVEDVINYPLNSIVLRKTSAITGELLAGAVFELYQVTPEISGTGGTLIGRYTTDFSGTVIITGLEAGTAFIAKEVQPPQGYMLSENSQQQAWLKADGTSIVELTFSNYPYASILVVKEDADTQSELAGAEFFVTDSSGAVIGENGGHYVTDATGSFLISGIKPGTSIVCREETAPDGYVLDATPQTLQVGSDGKTYTMKFYNKALGGLLIKKYSTTDRQPLSGAVFRITDINGAVVGEGDGMYTTDAQGTIYIPGLRGAFRATETKAPNGFQLDSNTQTINITDNKIYTLEFYNQPLQSITVTKKDGDSHSPLSGATIRITKADDTFVAERTTDSSGQFTVSGLADGFYKVFETKAPSSYILDSTVKLIQLQGGTPAVVELYNYKQGGIQINKVDALNYKGLYGAVYEVRRIDGTLVGSDYKTDSSGNVLIPNLQPGWYTVTELTPPSGYQNSPQYSDYSNYYGSSYYNGVSYYVSGSRVHFIYNGITYYSNGSTAYYIENGRTYRGYSDDDDVYTYVSGSTVRFRIDGITYYAIGTQPYYIENGRTYTGFPSGGNYGSNNHGSSGNAIGGYVLQGSASQNVQVKAGSNSTVIFRDYQYATLTIRKTDFVTKQAMKGVKFSVVHESGKRYGEYITNDFGEIIVNNELEKGVYIVTEISTIDGYKPDSTPRRIELNWGDSKRMDWENYPYGTLKIFKYDVQDTKPIGGVTFEILDKNKQAIGNYTTDGDGTIYLPKQFEAGTYYYRETKAPDGYLPITGLRSFEINWGKQTTVEVSNIPIEGQIEIIKRSSANNNITGQLRDAALANAEYTVYDCYGNVVEKLVTDGNGRAITKKLRYGKYTIKESKAPSYFVPNTDAHEIYIDVDGKVYTLELTNEPVNLSVNVEKSGYAEAMEGDTIKYEIYNVQNRSNVALDNFYLHDSIPVDAVRITRIFTGTYNQNLNYKIMYKTNLTGEFRVLRDNLFTDRIYEIDCTQGLQANEYVTDIKFEFGTVGVGFRETERPFFYCRVNDNLPHDYKFSNTVAVGGRYLEQVVKCDDRFTTSIYNVPEYKGKLPKTGE